MNAIIDGLMSHRSIRKFTEQPIAPELLASLVRAGQAAASSSFLQGVSVIRISDPELRQQLSEIAANQAYVREAAEFLVFCADLNRASRCCDWHGKTATEGFTEQFIIATVDTALMAQNVVVAAESEGLGICYIGAIRNDPARVAELLTLPRGVYPVFGLCLGYPAQDPELKPRLPLEVVLKENRYDQEGERERIAQYDAEVLNYYRTRTGGRREFTWSEQMSGMLSKEARPHMREFLEAQGLMLK
ncbi:MAG: oxygen-insensitive NADPH nitroreductase [Hyphomicrobiales bacterium]|nr:MAG: oxygen-insensitive NADPH nitroreductase [Hyphomicrobiales bacterium]